jgi:hypothetical protein
MNVDEVALTVGIVRKLYPAQRFDDDPQRVVEAWGLVIGDLSLIETRDAVVRLARRGQQWCAPGDIRREVATARNVLTPDVDMMLADMQRVAARQGVGRRLLPIAAQRVYASVGGAETIKRMRPAELAQMRRALVEQAEKVDRDVLVAQMPPPREAAHPLDDRQLQSLEAGPPERKPEGSPMPAELRRRVETYGKLP